MTKNKLTKFTIVSLTLAALAYTSQPTTAKAQSGFTSTYAVQFCNTGEIVLPDAGIICPPAGHVAYVTVQYVNDNNPDFDPTCTDLGKLGIVCH